MSRPSGGAVVVAAGILLSRISGLVRKMVFAAFFGTSALADAWTAALRLPNVLQNLLGEGSLSASFIPVYSEFLGEKQEDKARRFAGAALGLLAVVAGGLAILGALLAPWIVDIVVPGFEGVRRDATVTLVRILFPMTGTLVLAAWALGVLNSHRRFFVSYTAPVLWNLAIIGTLVTAAVAFGLRDVALLTAMGWGALAGGVLQLAVQIPFVVREMGGLRPTLDYGAEGVREAVRNLVPVVGARGFENLSSLVRDLTLAGLLAGGAVAILGFVQTLYVLPISLFGLSIGAAELPELSRERKADAAALAERIARALGQVQFWVVPTVVGYLLLGRSVIDLVYFGGAFGEDEASVTAIVLGVFSLGLLATASSRLLSSAFFALRDTRTPARVAVFRIVISLAVGAALMFPLDAREVGSLRLGAAGLAAGAAVASWVEYLVLRRALRGRVGSHGPGADEGLKVWASAAMAGALGWWVSPLLSQLPVKLAALGTLAVFGVAYLVLTYLMGLRYARLPRSA